jgi:hypothetical protein
MPALSNPRYERFAQALFAGLAGETRIKRAQSTAYLAAYPNCSKGNPAEAAASRLLRRVKPIIERVRELQAEANQRLEPKLDISRETRLPASRDLVHWMKRVHSHKGSLLVLFESDLCIVIHDWNQCQQNHTELRICE